MGKKNKTSKTHKLKKTLTRFFKGDSTSKDNCNIVLNRNLEKTVDKKVLKKIEKEKIQIDIGISLKPTHVHGPINDVSAVAFDSVQRILAVASNFTIHIFGGHGVHHVLEYKDRNTVINHMKFVVNQGILIVSVNQSRLDIWNLKLYRIEHSIDLKETITSIMIPVGSLAAFVGLASGHSALFNWHQGHVVNYPLAPVEKSALRCHRLNPFHDRELLLSYEGSVNPHIVVMEPQGKNMLYTYYSQSEDAVVTALAYAPSGDYFAAGFSSGEIMIWKRDSQEVPCTQFFVNKPEHRAPIISLEWKFIPDTEESIIFAASSNEELQNSYSDNNEKQEEEEEEESNDDNDEKEEEEELEKSSDHENNENDTNENDENSIQNDSNCDNNESRGNVTAIRLKRDASHIQRVDVIYEGSVVDFHILHHKPFDSQSQNPTHAVVIKSNGAISLLVLRNGSEHNLSRFNSSSPLVDAFLFPHNIASSRFLAMPNTTPVFGGRSAFNDLRESFHRLITRDTAFNLRMWSVSTESGIVVDEGRLSTPKVSHAVPWDDETLLMVHPSNAASSSGYMTLFSLRSYKPEYEIPLPSNSKGPNIKSNEEYNPQLETSNFNNNTNNTNNYKNENETDENPQEQNEINSIESSENNSNHSNIDNNNNNNNSNNNNTNLSPNNENLNSSTPEPKLDYKYIEPELESHDVTTLAVMPSLDCIAIGRNDGTIAVINRSSGEVYWRKQSMYESSTKNNDGEEDSSSSSCQLVNYVYPITTLEIYSINNNSNNLNNSDNIIKWILISGDKSGTFKCYDLYSGEEICDTKPFKKDKSKSSIQYQSLSALPLDSLCNPFDSYPLNQNQKNVSKSGDHNENYNVQNIPFNQKLMNSENQFTLFSSWLENYKSNSDNKKSFKMEILTNVLNRDLQNDLNEKQAIEFYIKQSLKNDNDNYHFDSFPLLKINNSQGIILNLPLNDEDNINNKNVNSNNSNNNNNNNNDNDKNDNSKQFMKEIEIPWDQIPNHNDRIEIEIQQNLTINNNNKNNNNNENNSPISIYANHSLVKEFEMNDSNIIPIVSVDQFNIQIFDGEKYSPHVEDYIHKIRFHEEKTSSSIELSFDETTPISKTAEYIVLATESSLSIHDAATLKCIHDSDVWCSLKRVRVSIIKDIPCVLSLDELSFLRIYTLPHLKLAFKTQLTSPSFISFNNNNNNNRIDVLDLLPVNNEWIICIAQDYLIHIHINQSDSDDITISAPMLFVPKSLPNRPQKGFFKKLFRKGNKTFDDYLNNNVFAQIKASAPVQHYPTYLEQPPQSSASNVPVVPSSSSSNQNLSQAVSEASSTINRGDELCRELGVTEEDEKEYHGKRRAKDKQDNNTQKNGSNDIRETKETMAENKRMLEERGERLEQMNDKAERMNEGAAQFLENVQKLKEQNAKKKWYQL